MGTNIPIVYNMNGFTIMFTSSGGALSVELRKRIIFASKDFSIGHKTKESDIMYMRPASGTVGLRPIEDKLIIGKEINKNIYKFEPIKLRNLNDK